ncbi:MAG: hypothetical protein ACRBK7_10230 [Acidimicrobiales bacterium]
MTFLVAALLAMLAEPVIAQTPDVPPPRQYGESGVDNGVVKVRARSNWLPAGSSGSGSSSSCTTRSVRIVVEDDFRQPVNGEWRSFGPDGSIPFTASSTDLPSSLPTYLRQFAPTGRWYAVSCDGDISIVAEGGPPVTVAALMQQALDQVDPPDPELAVTPETLHFTQLQSWLAVEPSYWNADRQATAAAGRVAVTATVTPVESSWDMGDGNEVTCAGPGTVWQAGLDPAAATCSHVYRTSSAGAPGDAFDIAATVRFNVDITTNAPGSYGPFVDIERTTVDAVQVGEIQAVND